MTEPFAGVFVRLLSAGSTSFSTPALIWSAECAQCPLLAYVRSRKGSPSTVAGDRVHFARIVCSVFFRPIRSHVDHRGSRDGNAPSLGPNPCRSAVPDHACCHLQQRRDRKSTRLN